MSRVRRCETVAPEGYVRWHAWAEHKTDRGEEQAFCATCQRYRFKSEWCHDFAEGTDPALGDVDE